ncbi:MAG: UDP-N-acetylglucosamine 2-epimerase (non-hydrolyzing) [Gemmatimonadales bacterium]|nr:UDP-N-acetylglucosamine 2-epimerase (non-hydrolyzing) [Gemmatimonadales bacterium]
MSVLVVAGARPNFMKVAPIIRALDAAGVARSLVHTGQHYDAAMSDAFFTDLGLPKPDAHLGVGSGTHAQQTARVMEGFEPVLLSLRPRWVLVVGDVNSTLACALVAAKLRQQLGCGIVHVEAGLRSGDWTMPEEVNRVLTDRLADVLHTPSRDAHPNLEREGIEADRVTFVGNVMIDTLVASLPRARATGTLARLGVTSGGYIVTTLHRPANVDQRDVLAGILEGLDAVARDRPVVFPIHPRTRARIGEFGLDRFLARLTLAEPLGYLDMLAVTDGAAACLTDSGGLQEETTALGVPCVTLRQETERPVTVTHGTNVLAPWPPSPAGVREAAAGALARGRVGVGERAPEGWDGKAAERVVADLVRRQGA